MDNEILTLLSGHKTDESIIEQGFIGSSQQGAGCFIKTRAVYNIHEGLVIDVSKDPYTSTWDVTVEIDSQHWIRYCRLSATAVFKGATIEVNKLIGYSYKGMMRLEYCTAETSGFPVRILLNQLYKQDPASIIFGGFDG